MYQNPMQNYKPKSKRKKANKAYISYDEKEDFGAKMQKFGAKMNKNKKHNDQILKKKQKKKGGKLKLSAKARAMGRNEHAIKVNLDSVKAKVKFGRLVVYSVNTLANLAENRFNCDYIIEQGGIKALKEVMANHKSNPAVMKEASRMVKNLAKSSPENAKKLADEGVLDECVNVLKQNPDECGEFVLNSMDAILKSSDNPKKIAKKIVKLGGIDALENALKKYPNNPDLAAAVVKHMNNLMDADPKLAAEFAKRKMWNPILKSMQMNPNHGPLAINGCKALQVYIIILY